MLIKTYGLFWERENVFWGKQGVRGTLLGISKRSKKAPPVCFRKQIGIYILYDENFKIVYIGQAGSKKNEQLFTRLRKHCKDHLAPRWKRFSWFGLYDVVRGVLTESTPSTPRTTDILNQVEAILISSAEPPCNKQGGRFGKRVTQYLQHRDENNLEPEINKLIRDFINKQQQ